MFTGLVESVGEVATVERRPSGFRLRLRTALSSELARGESLAVNGVCLTVVSTGGGHVEFDVGPESARVTTLGSLEPGCPVNLERSMAAEGRFGGHFVLGHVDATGIVESQKADGDAHWLTISFGEELSPLLVQKGAVAVDGVSLTIAALGDRSFQVMIVPHTWEHTNLGALRVGDAVNIECDVLGKYVTRIMDVAAARAVAATGDRTPG
jgi:riboflavin synthase